MRVKVNGIELEVNQTANNGDTVIFLHYSSGNQAMWNGVVPYFMDKYQVITLDIRGHGKSEKPEVGYKIDQMASDVIEVMNQLGINQAHIIGSSLGGEVAASLAANYPDRIQSITAEGAIQNYFGTNGSCDIAEEEIPSKKEELRAKRAERVIPIFDSIDEKIESVKVSYEESGIKWTPYLKDFVIYDSLENDNCKIINRCPKWVMDQYVEDFWDTNFDKYFEKIKCPVLFLPSEEESKCDDVKATIEKYKSTLDVCKVVNIPGAMHAYLTFQYPQEFSKQILDFYREI